jgi:tyrosine-protein phosphatase YwqE
MSWLNKLFASAPKTVSAGFQNPITTELHSHLIPAVDDGVQTMEQSLLILKRFAELGYKKVITTPHIMADFYKNSKENLLPALEEVKNELRKQEIDIELQVAAEYMIDDLFIDKVLKKELLTFGKNYVLIEMPFDQEAPNIKEAIFELQLNNYQPVLAHPERYLYYAYNKSKYEDLVQQGILFQMNLFSLVGYYSPEQLKTVEHLIKNKMISFVGSDIHAPRHLKILDDSLQAALYEELCTTNKLLNNSL